ncbi:hypothetical protein CBM2600_B10488 [Cupriavidus taiwanensis]|nr:hypothetical protein CBM2600_B10488 [Cupriavidus taiwanensis]
MGWLSSGRRPSSSTKSSAASTKPCSRAPLDKCTITGDWVMRYAVNCWDCSCRRLGCLGRISFFFTTTPEEPARVLAADNGPLAGGLGCGSAWAAGETSALGNGDRTGRLDCLETRPGMQAPDCRAMAGGWRCQKRRGILQGRE